MEHSVITCDICNPQDGTKGIVKLPYPNEWRGYFEGPRSAAAEAGWKVGPSVDICPECQVPKEA